MPGGMTWIVETLSEAVDNEIAALPPRIQAKLLWIMEQIESRGLTALRPPHIAHLEDRLYELRARGQGPGARKAPVGRCS